MLVPPCAAAHLVACIGMRIFTTSGIRPATKVKRVTASQVLHSFLFLKFFYIIHLVLSTRLRKYLLEYFANRNEDFCQRRLANIFLSEII
eukprot:s2129_g3.t1